MPGGRPRAANKRQHVISTRISEDEFLLIQRRAAILEISISNYVRYTALGLLPYWPPTHHELALSREKGTAPDTTRSGEWMRELYVAFHLLKIVLAKTGSQMEPGSTFPGGTTFLECYANADDLFDSTPEDDTEYNHQEDAPFIPEDV